MNYNDYYMQQAIKEAEKGIKLGHGGPFGCVVVKNGKIIAKGHNQVVSKNDPTCHGEIDAIRNACKQLKTFDLKGSILYSTGYPCPMCLGAILWANIEKVYYGCTNVDIAELNFRDKSFQENLFALQATLCEETNRKECLNLFARYRNIENKTHY